MTSDRRTTFVGRREVLSTLATGFAAASLHPLLTTRSFAQDVPPAKPSTNIKEALAHPRVASSLPGRHPGRVVQATDEHALAGEKPDVPTVDRMLRASLLQLTGLASVKEAWSTFVTPEDTIGIKVNPVAGKLLSTSLELVQVILRQLEEAGIPRERIVIWDRREFEMHEVGFTTEAFPGVTIVGTERKDAAGSFTDAEGKLYSEAMIDRAWYYWADVEGKYDAETLPYMVNEGKHSYFSSICTNGVTKIINVPILKNAGASVTLCLKNLAFGAITNTGRLHKQLWAETCAEVPAFPPLRDKTVLNIVDGIKGCYQGGPGANPEFITAFNTLLVGTDPVAVDRIGYDMILATRREKKIQQEESPRGRAFLELAAQLGLGTADRARIDLAKA
jgi:hypothetical protein